MALGSQEVPSSEPPKSRQTKRVRESVGSHKAAGGSGNEVPTRPTGQPMPKKLKTSDPTEAPEAPGKTQRGKESAAKRRSEPGTREEIEDVAVMSDEDLDGVPMEVETEVAEEKVSEGEEEDVVDGDDYTWYAMGGRTGVPGGSRTPTAGMCLYDLGFLTWLRAHNIADDSTVTDAALRYALVTEILEGRPIRPRVINGVLVAEDILRWPLALVWDKWLWGPSEFDRQQAYEVQTIYSMILERTGREF